MKLLIDGMDIQRMSIDQIGATLQQIAGELMDRAKENNLRLDRMHDLNSIAKSLYNAALILRWYCV